MEPLHELISSMTPSEKGYFKKYASPQSEKDYIKLFDAIAGMEEYDEELLVRKFKKAPFLKNLSRTKNYLYHSIVRALLVYHEDSSPKVIIANMLNEAEMLFTRGMLHQARKRVDKAKAITRNGEWFILWLEVLAQQGRLCDFRAYTPEELDVTQLPGEIAEVTGLMNNFFSYVALNQQQEKIANPSFLFRRGEVKEKLLDHRNQPLLKDESSAKSTRAKLLFNYIHYFNRMLLQDYRAALGFAEHYLALISGHVNIREATPQLLMQAYNMLISCLQMLPEPELLEGYLNELRQLPVKGNWMEAAKFQNHCAPALYFYHMHFRKKEFMELAEDARQKLETFHHNIKVDLRLGIYVTMSDGYLKFGKYAEAIEVIELYRQYPPKDMRNDYQNYLMFNYLIAQYEKGNQQLVRNLLGNTGQLMKRNKEFSEIENLMLKVFSTVLDTPDKRTRNLALNDLHTRILKTAEDAGGGRWMELASLTTPFIESRIKGVKYHEWVLQAHDKG